MPRAVFTSTGSHTWTPPTGVTSCSVLRIGGGASGGRAGSTGGGGGAGAVLWSTGVSCTPGVPVSLSVGSGGASMSATGTGNAGNPSTFGGLPAAAGGGGGGGGSSGPAASGGSGGGGAGNNSAISGASGDPGGNGGNGYDNGSAPQRRGGGGGGAGGNGGNATSGASGTGGNGGVGIQLSTLHADLSDLGVSGWVAGGGGGGALSNTTGALTGAGGQGGGGRGGSGNSAANSAGVAGAANTGSGGGGGGSNNSGQTASTGASGAGGSGLVVVLWDEPAEASEGETITGHTWTASATGTAPEIVPDSGSTRTGHAWTASADGASDYHGSTTTTAQWTASAAGVQSGQVAPVVISDTSTSSLTNPAYRPGKGHRWAWWTGSRWDCVLPTSSGWRIYTGLGTTPTQGPVVTSTSSHRVTTAYHGNTLWTLASGTSSTVCTRWTRSGTTYTSQGSQSLSGFTVTDADSSPATLLRDPNGRLWAAIVTATHLVVAVSDDDGDTWTSTQVAVMATTGVATLAVAGSDMIVGVALNDGLGRSARRHALTGPLASGWTTETLPSLPGSTTSDDHGQAVSDGTTVYWSNKTSDPSAAQPLIQLLVRSPGGTWTGHAIVLGPDSGTRPTRPTLALTPGHLHVMWGHINSPHSIAYVTLLRSDPGSVPSPVSLITGGQYVDGAVTPPGVLTHETGIPLLAHNRATGTIWRATLAVAAPPSGASHAGHAWGASAQGETDTSGSTTTAHSWGSSASGAADRAGSTGTGHAWGASASGDTDRAGTGSTGHTWASSTTGSTTRTGQTATGHSWTSAASGATTPAGTASAGHSWTARATGDTARDGTAATGHRWTVTAHGVTVAVDAHTGRASTGHSWGAAASGTADRSGSAATGHDWGAWASGRADHAGHARTAHRWTTRAAGATSPSGQASTGHAWASGASGTAPIPGQHTGHASTGHTWGSTASGSAVHSGHAATAHQWATAATGETARSGSTRTGHSWAARADTTRHQVFLGTVPVAAIRHGTTPVLTVTRLL